MNLAPLVVKETTERIRCALRRRGHSVETDEESSYLRVDGILTILGWRTSSKHEGVWMKSLQLKISEVFDRTGKILIPVRTFKPGRRCKGFNIEKICDHLEERLVVQKQQQKLHDARQAALRHWTEARGSLEAEFPASRLKARESGLELQLPLLDADTARAVLTLVYGSSELKESA